MTSLRRRRNLTSVSNVCEVAPISCSVPPTDSTNYRKCVSNFLLSWLANRQWLFNRPIMARTQILVGVGAQNKDFGTQCFANGLNQSLVSFVVQARRDWHVNIPSFPGALLDHGVGELFSPKRVWLFWLMARNTLSCDRKTRFCEEKKRVSFCKILGIRLVPCKMTTKEVWF